MPYMSVTLDVLNLTGWLKADSAGRPSIRKSTFVSKQEVESGACVVRSVRAGRRGELKGVGYSSVHADDPRLGGCGGRARAAVRTQNIFLMFVTPDVSKLTSWLKASAFCRKQGV